MSRTDKDLWKVGELASETGLTVRTLHYYDQIGLLTPTRQTDGGHRLYERKDLMRLQKITMLKQLGFPLEQVRDAIDKPSFDLAAATANLRRI